MTDELGKASGQGPAEEDEGLMMRRKRDDKTGEQREQEELKEQRLLRCLSDPGPAINEEEEEDEPFLHW